MISPAVKIKTIEKQSVSFTFTTHPPDFRLFCLPTASLPNPTRGPAPAAHTFAGVVRPDGQYLMMIWREGYIAAHVPRPLRRRLGVAFGSQLVPVLAAGAAKTSNNRRERLRFSRERDLLIGEFSIAKIADRASRFSRSSDETSARCPIHHLMSDMQLPLPSPLPPLVGFEGLVGRGTTMKNQI